MLQSVWRENKVNINYWLQQIKMFARVIKQKIKIYYASVYSYSDKSDLSKISIWGFRNLSRSKHILQKKSQHFNK